MSEPKWLNPGALRLLHGISLARDGGPAGVRDEGLLDSALARPRNAFAYGEEDVCVLAALYAEGVAKNHPLFDGNKRAAFIAAIVFLEKNGLVFTAGEADAAAHVIALAAGEIDAAALAAWLRENSVPV